MFATFKILINWVLSFLSAPGEDKPLEVHGNPNVLTRDKGSSSLAQGPTAHSCLVEVERFEGALPENNVFNPIPTVVAAAAENG